MNFLMHYTKMLICLAVIMGSVIAGTNKSQSYLYLHLKKCGEEISLVSSSLFESAYKNRFKSYYGGIEYVVKTAQGLVYTTDFIKDPCVIPYDYLDASNGSKIAGGIHILDETSFAVRIPYTEPLQDISFYMRTPEGTRGKRLSTVSLVGIEKRTKSIIADRQAEITLFQGDSVGNRVNYVCFSEGYTQSELDNGKFISDLTKGVGIQFNEEPYKRYKGHFNVWAVSVPSSSSGLGGYFNSTANGRLIYLGSGGADKVEALLQQLKPEYDMVLVLINTTTYGGAGGTFATATINSASGDLILHETGHGYANLADEYQTPWSITPREMPNCTKETVRENIKWTIWIDPSTPVPTPESSGYDETGLFEGCMYQTTGWYRPKDYCKMRVLSSGFCAVCRETIITRAYKSASPVDGQYPEQSPVNYSDINGKKMTITPLQPATNSITTNWTVNGISVLEDSDELDLTQVSLNNGTNTIRAYVADETEWVKIPENLPALRDTITWTVNYDPNSISGTTVQLSNSPLRILSDKSGFPVKITFTINKGGTISVALFDTKGAVVRSFYNGDLGNGTHSISVTDRTAVPSGVYFLTLKAGESILTRKVRIVK